MKITKHIISLVLLGVFLLPLTYPSLHILFESEHHHEHKHQKNVADGNSIEESDDEESCLICDYEFFIYPLPNIFIHEFKLFVGENIFCQQKTSFIYLTICTIKTPRAPPYFC